MKVAEALRSAAHELAPVSGTPRLDAELLMACALGLSRETMLLGHLAAPAPPSFTDLVRRRVAHEPVAYIVGHRDFWTIDLAVGPGVLIPRPDSETLLEAAVARFGREGPRRVLDLGTGPGTLLLAALAQWAQASGLGIDRSDVALRYARANADRLGLSSRATFRLGDWTAGLEERFDLILCNPPYVEAAAPLAPEVADWEPAGALFAGADGLDDYRRLAPLIPHRLARAGIACIEVGAGQADAVAALLSAAGLAALRVRDLAGHERCLVASVPE